MSTALKQALWYRRRLGWSVFPVHGIRDGACTCGNPTCDRPGKHAVIKWEAYQKNLPPVEQVEADFAHRPGANIGLATGAVSGVVVVDVDEKEGCSGGEYLQQLLDVYGPLPDTVEALTGGGGRHIYFQHPGFPIRNRTGILPGLDFRGDGGYVLVPTSGHISGRAYEWEASSRPDEVKPAPMPDWLVKLIAEPEGEGGLSGTKDATEWAKLIVEGAPEGTRNDSATRLAGRLLRHGLMPSEALAWLQIWNRNLKAPLTDDEIFRTVKSIAQREAGRRKGRTG